MVIPGEIIYFAGTSAASLSEITREEAPTSLTPRLNHLCSPPVVPYLGAYVRRAGVQAG